MYRPIKSSSGQAPQTNHITARGTHGSIKYGPIRVLFFNRELQIAGHYLRPPSESYINILIFNSHGESQIMFDRSGLVVDQSFNGHGLVAQKPPHSQTQLESRINFHQRADRNLTATASRGSLVQRGTECGSSDRSPSLCRSLWVSGGTFDRPTTHEQSNRSFINCASSRIGS